MLWRKIMGVKINEDGVYSDGKLIIKADVFNKYFAESQFMINNQHIS